MIEPRPNQSFLQSERPNTAPRDARFHIIPVPFEASVSYGAGTALGPEAILRASDQLELWDGFSIPADEGIHTAPVVDCSGQASEVLARIEAATATAVKAGGMPFLLGGEHTVSLGALRALAALNPEPFGIVQFDAHADLREEYEENPLSHACVMRRAVEETGAKLFQIGVRALCAEEHAWRNANNISHLDAFPLARAGLPEALLPPDFPKRIYLTFDIDGLDPSVMPATGTPVPGGLSWHTALECLERCIRGRSVIGADVVEFAPIDGLHYADATAAQLVYAIMGAIQRLAAR